MQPLSFAFSALKMGTVYWHDHIGLCCLLKALPHSNLDSYSLMAIQQRPNIPNAYDMKFDEVYLLPMDRGDDLVAVPGASFIKPEDALELSAKASLTEIGNEAFEISPVPYFILSKASFDFITEIKLREKLPNYATRDNNDYYKECFNFNKVQAKVLGDLKEMFEQADAGHEVDFDALKDTTDNLLEAIGKALDARSRATKRNLG